LSGRGRIFKAPISNAYERASYYSGVSRKVVVEIVSYFRKTGTVQPQVKAGNTSNHKTLINSNATGRIRQFIFERHRNGESCNAKHIQDLLEQEFQLKIHLRTVQHNLNRLGFEYKRNKPKPRSLREKQYIRQQRHTYLHQIQKFRDAGYTTVYLDESFLHHYHGQKFSWFSEGDFLERPSGKGRRWCFIHAISPGGLLAKSSMIFEGKKSTGDYHGSFNFDVFYDWFHKQLIPNLPGKSCIIMDRATYHMVPEERLIPAQMRKLEIQQWLTEHDIFWKDYWLKPKLQETLEQNIDRTPIVQKDAQQKGHQLLLLPVHHPELNAIELVWAIVKNDCAKKLRNGMSFKDVLQHLQKAFDDFPKQMCQSLCEHVKEIEKEFWEVDLELDQMEESDTQTV
jgi:transposase